ncbi:hypothetical protein OJAV_G00157800 [Oryzias javanicus]|uniref:Tc1-like transposase DDE domain-containing protein n=1 Tax=Oryzias javanicus TaxID=123683 RepID=A0A437CIN4_ORYJA|nr:hypothetical protein OJAV_G00157800 [Oryzias javanicus]
MIKVSYTILIFRTVFEDVHPQSGLVHPPSRVHDSRYDEARGGQSGTADRRHSPPAASARFFLLRGNARRLSSPRSAAIQVFHATTPPPTDESKFTLSTCDRRDRVSRRRDLNPIEHIWKIMSRSIHQRQVEPQTVQELPDALVQMLEEILL